ncbi:MAG: response regulator [Kofleriaceae bacterium]
MTERPCRGVLVVEDDAGIRESIIQVLDDNEFASTGAENGAVALERLRASQGAHPCLILLDMMMPIMDGKRFRLSQQDDPALAGIPVVVLTAHPSGERTARDLDVAGFLKKPVDLQDLLNVVQRYCEPNP